MDINFSQWVIDFIAVVMQLEFTFLLVWFVVHFTKDFDELIYKTIKRIKSRKKLKEEIKKEEENE